MIIIGVDFQPEFQQIAWVETDTGELQEQRLQHREEAETFYQGLAARAVQVRIGCARDGTISSGLSSVRMRDSPEIAMVCSRTPRH
jgi:hypothetical protein